MFASLNFEAIFGIYILFDIFFHISRFVGTIEDGFDCFESKIVLIQMFVILTFCHLSCIQFTLAAMLNSKMAAIVIVVIW